MLFQLFPRFSDDWTNDLDSAPVQIENLNEIAMSVMSRQLRCHSKTTINELITIVAFEPHHDKGREYALSSSQSIWLKNYKNFLYY